MLQPTNGTNAPHRLRIAAVRHANICPDPADTTKKLLILLLMLLSLGANAQPTRPADYGMKAFSITDPKLGRIGFYIDTTNIQKKAPLFIDVNGSGGMPLCLMVAGNGFKSILNSFDTKTVARTAERYHYVILDKPGTPFCDTIHTQLTAKQYDPKAITAAYRYSEEYTQKLSLQWRVAATQKVIGFLIKNGYWDKTTILAYGYSEGAQVVPALAFAEKRITHIAALAGSGLNQLADGIASFRAQARNGTISAQAAQDSVQSKLRQIAAIYAEPGSTSKSIDGHSYKRWASFGALPPIEYLRRLDIPIYMVAGTDDESSPIYGLDYVALEFIRLGKTNLTYDVCVSCGHYLTSSGDTPAPDYLQRVLDWAEKNTGKQHISARNR